MRLAILGLVSLLVFSGCSGYGEPPISIPSDPPTSTVAVVPTIQPTMPPSIEPTVTVSPSSGKLIGDSMIPQRTPHTPSPITNTPSPDRPTVTFSIGFLRMKLLAESNHAVKI